MDIAVVALGKIGLPLAVQAAGRGHRVRGADIDERTVALVNAATPPFPGEAGLDEQLGAAVAAGRLDASTNTGAAVEVSDVVVVVVPLVVDAAGHPDFQAIDSATRAVGSALRPGTLVSYETTVPVGTTRTRFAPALAEESGLELGRDLFVCHSPERVSSGRVFADLRRYPKLIGGIDRESAARAVAFYEAVLEFEQRLDLVRANGVWDLGSAEAAELTKLAETTYRDVNIALANTFARYADAIGVDVDGVIAAANSQPYSHLHQPGVAVGGHCIPVYPRFYLAGDPDAALPAAGRDVNESMPAYAVERLSKALGGLAGRTVLVLGAAYRGGVKETAFSGAFPLVTHLAAAGAVVHVHDPLYSAAELRNLGLEPHPLGASTDAAILQAEHAEYLDWGPGDLPGIQVLLDGRAFTRADRWPGVRHMRLGDGGDG